MFIRLVLFLNFFLVASVAHADPISAIGLVVSGVQALASGASVLGLIVRAALGLGLSLLQQTLNRQKNKQSSVGSVLEIKMGDDQPMTFPVGSRAVGGRRKYIGSWGSAGGTPNAYLTDVIEISNLPSYAGPLGISSLWVGQRKCGVLWDRPDPDGRGYPVQQFMKPNGTVYMWIKYYDGTQTGADPFLVSKFGSHPDRPYGADRIGRGCQYVIVTTRLDNDLQLGGSPPEILVEPHPTPMYDARKDSTNGGSGSHRFGDWTTYEPTLNPMVIAYNIVRGVYYTPDEWVFGGQNVAASRLPNSAWFAAMNECDRDGQYRCGLEVQCDQEPLDVIEDLRVACAGRLAEVGGMIKPLVGAPGAAIYAFDDTGIIITDEQDFEPFPSLTSTHNSIAGTYPEPEQRWTVTDAPEARNLDQEAQDGQRSLPAPVRFDAVPFSDQVQHLMKTMAAEQRRFRIHTLTLPPSAYALEPNDVTSWTSARNVYGNKKFIVTAITGLAGMLQRVTLLEIDPTDYDPPAIYVPAPNGWIGPITAPSQPMTGWAVEPATIKDAGGIDRRPAIKISCGQDLEDVAGVWVQVRLKATGDVVFDSDSNQYASPFSWIISGNWMISNTDYEARGRYLPKSNRATDWSAWLTVKTPNVLIQASDVLDGAIIASKIADAAVTAAKIMDEAVTNLKLADQAVSTAKIEVAAVTAEVLASGAVISTKLADGAVTAAKLAQGTVDATSLANSIKAIEVVSDLPTSGNVEGRQVFLTTDGKLYRYHNGAWTAATSATDITGQMTDAQIAAVAAAKVTGALVSSQIADAAVTNAKLAASAIDATKFASGIRPVEIVSSLPTTGNIEGRTVYLTTDDKLYRYTGSAWTSATAAGDIAGQIVGTQISDGAISTPKLAAGAVTADRIAANSITAGQIAAGAVSASQIAAGAVTSDKLASNSVSTNKLAVGSGVNLLQNSSFTMGTDCWTYLPWGTIPGLSLALNAVGWSWSGRNNSTLRLLQNSGPAGADTYADIRWLRPDGAALAGSLKYSIPCAPSEWLEATAYVSAHRCQVELYIAWVGADGSEIGYSSSATNSNNGISGDANNPDLWLRLRVVAAAPSNAVAASILIRKRDTQQGFTDSYAFVNKPMLCRIPAGATEPTPWSDGGVVLITNGGIVANAITADKIAANAITAKSLVLQDWENLIPDNQMQSPAAWPLLSACVLKPAATLAFASKGSLDYTYAAGAGYQQIVIGPAFAIVPGQQYLVSVQVARTAGTKAGLWVRVHWLNANGALLNPDQWGDIVGVNGIMPPLNEVQTYSNTITPPTGAFGARVQIYIQRDYTDGNLSIGGLSCLRKASANLIVDGAIIAGKIAASAVTAGTIAANAVSAGTIAAGAVSATQIAAGAITADKLASSSITTNALAVGSGKNLLQNASFTMGMDCWTYAASGPIPGLTMAIRTATESWAGPNNPTLMLYQGSGPTAAGYFADIRWMRPDSDKFAGQLKFAFPCAPGEWFEATAYVSAHRCQVELRIEWEGADGNWISYTAAAINNANGSDGNNPDNWPRLRVAGAAPANAVAASIHIRKGDTQANATDSYAFINKPMLCRVPAGATEPTPWSDGGVVMITNGGIVANAITADKIAANAVTAGKVAANAITAGTIAAGAVTATTISGGTITGDKLAANTIGAGQIAADAITAKQLVLTDFSNIADNGWQTGSLDGWVTENVQAFYNDTISGDVAGWVLQSLGRNCAISNYIAVTAGETYAFDVWVYNTDSNAAAIYAIGLSPTGAGMPVQLITTATKNTWVRLQVRYTVPSGMTKLAMALICLKTAGTGTSCYWSKPVMRRAVSAELIVDGAITANKIAVNSLDAITANLGAVNISSAVIGSLQVGTSNIQGGAVTGVGAGRVAGTQTIGANGTANLVSCVVNVAGDGRVVIDAMTLGQFNQNGGSQNSQPIGCNIFRDGTAIFSQTYYLGVVQTVVQGSSNNPTQATYTAGLVAVSGLYDAPGAGNHTYILQIYCPGNTIGWNESNITATALKR